MPRGLRHLPIAAFPAPVPSVACFPAQRAAVSATLPISRPTVARTPIPTTSALATGAITAITRAPVPESASAIPVAALTLAAAAAVALPASPAVAADAASFPARAAPAAAATVPAQATVSQPAAVAAALLR